MPLSGRKQLSLFPVVGLEPFAQYLPVHEDMLQKPRVADFIEAGFNVAFQHPFPRLSEAERWAHPGLSDFEVGGIGSCGGY